MKTKKVLSVLFFLAFTAICCNAQDQNTGVEKYKFRWRHQAQSGSWCKWDTTGTYGSSPDTVLLQATSHAGNLKFQAIIDHKKGYSAYISWSNSIHSLESKLDFVKNYFTSQVSIRVEYSGEVSNPDTFYLVVERIK